MKAQSISVLVSKKLSKQFNSWSISYGVSGELEQNEQLEDALVRTQDRLKNLLTKQLPTPETKN